MWLGRHNHSGSQGAKKGYNRDQLAYTSVKTSYVQPQFSIDLAGSTGIEDITPTVGSLDGQVWLCSAEGGTAQYVLTFRRIFEEERQYLTPVGMASVDATEKVVQRGRDWILTDHYFVAHRHDNDQVFARQARYANGLVMPAGTKLPGTEGYYTEFEFRNETGWPFIHDYAANTFPPYWERMNPAVGGWTILHDWLVPRADYGFQNQSVGAGSPMWTPDFVPYDVREPGYFTPSPGHIDAPNTTKHSLWGGLPYMKQKYAVFVVDGTIYVRTNKFIGTGKFMPLRSYFDENNVKSIVSYVLLNMHDFNLWKRNCDLDWENVVVGKIGNTVVAYECAEGLYPPEEQPAMRLAPTGRYIPLTRKIAWDEDPDGTNESLIPQIRNFTPAEEEEIRLSLSCFLNDSACKAYGYNDDIFKVCNLKDGAEPAGGNALPAYRNATNHFRPGGTLVVGSLDDFVVSCEKERAYITDTKPPLFRMDANYASLPASLETHVMKGEEEGDPSTLWEGLSIFNARPGRLDVTDIGHIVTENYEEKSIAEQWADNTIVPCDISVLSAVSGTDVAEDMLLADRFPVLLRDITAATEPGDTQESLRVAWINPETGDVSPIEKHFFQGFAMRPCIKFDEDAKTAVFGCRSESTGAFETIPTPSYLDGWFGPTDVFHFQSEYPMGYPNSAWTQQMAFRYAPSLEFSEIVSICFLTARYGTQYATGYAGNPVTEGAYQDRHFMDFPMCDAFIGLRVSSPLVNRIVRDMARMTSSGWESIQIRHKNGTQALGWPQYWDTDGKGLYRVDRVAYAHYCKEPFLFREDIPMWRFRQQLNVCKCRKDKYDDINSTGDGAWSSIGQKWSDHRFLAFRIDVNEEAFKSVCNAWKLNARYNQE